MTITTTAPAVITRRTVAQPDTATLSRWGAEVEVDGIDAHEDTADILVSEATRRGVRPVLAQILADRREPSVARQRAFGKLAFALAS